MRRANHVNLTEKCDVYVEAGLSKKKKKKKELQMIYTWVFYDEPDSKRQRLEWNQPLSREEKVPISSIRKEDDVGTLLVYERSYR